MKPVTRSLAICLCCCAVLIPSNCRRQRTGGMVGVAFESLQSEGWVVGYETIKRELAKNNLEPVEAIANSDANLQYEQVNTFLARGVDGIIIAPVDAQTVIPMIKAANEAQTPIVLYNRAPALNDGKWVAVVNNNYMLTRATVNAMAATALNSDRKYKAMILVGSLTDMNAVQRRNGFEDELKAHGDAIEVLARISTDWNQEKAMAGVTNAIHAHPDINFIFCSSDFLLPSIESALRVAGSYKKMGEPGHVLLGSFDGDKNAYRMLSEGYLDADGVQDLSLEAVNSVQAIRDMRAGKPVPQIIEDKGFVVTQENFKEMGPKMWGATQKQN